MRDKEREQQKEIAAERRRHMDRHRSCGTVVGAHMRDKERDAHTRTRKERRRKEKRQINTDIHIDTRTDTHMMRIDA